VKIAPEFQQPVVHVVDASRAVDVVSSLLNQGQRERFVSNNRTDQERIREQHGALKRRPMLPWRSAQNHRLQLDWQAGAIAVPSFTGTRVVEPAIEELLPFVDWTLFFSAWELKGRFPAILEHPKYGEAARELYEHAQELLQQVMRDRLLTARGVYGFWPAASDGEDIVLYERASGGQLAGEILRFNMLRQQEENPDAKPNRSLADYIAPRTSGLTDYLGAFAVTAGIGVDALVAAYERDHDDYHAIMVKALADRLAEAFAEYLHAQARRDWGFGHDENLTNDQLIAEEYRGIRPAFGYPACPDHSEKTKLFDLLRAERAGVALTEHFAMTPAAAVSGLYFGHPQAAYFTVGRVDRDQVSDYARRKGEPLTVVERWLTPNLAYDPALVPA
jgi:5-methyltetrahydrofolate--homocysteine methyltransferase